MRGLPEVGGELPVAVLAEEILTPGDGQIRALVTSCGNPVLSTPNGRRLDRALEDLEFMVSIDFYLNETTRHADLILPPTSPLEHDHYDVAFLSLAVRNVARYSPPLFEPPPGALHDWQIFNGLIDRLAPAGGPRKWLERWFRRRGPRATLAAALRAGPHEVTLSKLERAPHGIDLGPLVELLPGRLWTEDRKIHLLPPLLRDDLDRLEEHLGRAPHGSGSELTLIGRRHVRSNNSWMHNSHRLVKGPGRCTLMVHPDDAARLGLADGAPVRVASSISAVNVAAEVTADVMPGVVSLPHGWGHDREGVRLGTARQHAGASMNDLTDDQAVDPACGNAVLSGMAVRLEPVAPETSSLESSSGR